ncbi:MAG: hypothetical protein ONB06_11005 [candidate division KSB1 bacterium]|nr:hypothetical protein [candidate division KSB1 bacterium]
MKQFTRCANCQQWYVRTYTARVELYQSDSLRYTTLWCLRCIEEAERRSQPPLTSLPTADTTSTPDIASRSEASEPRPASGTFEQYMQEHLHLMDRALYDDEAILVPLIQDFMERCRLYQTHLERPDQLRRLAGHLQYWETFLKALNA